MAGRGAEMLKTDKVIIVEGKYDKIKLSSVIDGMIITTEGFSLFKDKEKQAFLRKLAVSKGIIVLTDSDAAGFQIRSFIKSITGNNRGDVVQVYIPDIFGKEKRKDSYSKEGKLGVEGIDKVKLTEVLTQAGIGTLNDGKAKGNGRNERLTSADLYEDGLIGGEGSTQKRRKVLALLELPQRMSSKAMIETVNEITGVEAYRRAVLAETDSQNESQKR